MRKRVRLFAAAVLYAGAAQGGDGAIEINQAKALAGSVNACDTPGFPVSICDSGSYRMTSNLNFASAASSAIVVTASDVSIDFGGNSVIGTNTCTIGSNGWVTGCVQSSGPDGINAWVPRVELANGRVIGTANVGVRLGTHARLRNFQAIQNGATGVIAGAHSILRDVASHQNWQFGLLCEGDCDAAGVTSSQNRGDGLIAGAGTTAADIAAIQNQGLGIYLDIGSQLARFVSKGNGLQGVVAGDGSVLSVGSVRDNNQAGGTAYGMYLGGGAGYQGVVVTATGGGNAATVAGQGVNLGNNSCQGGTCP